MTVARVPTLLISGPVGVGKSTVADEVSSLLSRREVPHTLVDLDVLAATFPRPDDDPFHQQLGLDNLASIWTNARAAGSRNLVIARVVEHATDLDGYRVAVPGAEVVVVQLRASEAVLLERVDRRECGSGRAWHRARAVELARQLDDAPGDVIDTTGRAATHVAAEVVDTVGWEVDP